MSKIRRINLFGGPGAGKSTIAADIFSNFKRSLASKASIEHCSEYVKRWAYLKRDVGKHDQIYLFAKQQQMEYTFLNNNVDLIVTDSPCLLSLYYSIQLKDNNIIKALSLLNKSYDEDFKPLNIFINRGDKPYIQNGRWQAENEAKEIDLKLKSILTEFYGGFYEIDYKDRGYLSTIEQLILS